MKKLLGLLSLIIYLVSTNALIHADFMGILPGHASMGASCHSHHANTPSDKQSVDCCELVYSNQYSHTQIQLQTIQHISDFAFTIQQSHILAFQENTSPEIIFNNSPPGRNPNIKYHKFSDLTGIIVDLA